MVLKIVYEFLIIAEIAVRAAPAALLAAIAGTFFKARCRGFSFSSSALILLSGSSVIFMSDAKYGSVQEVYRGVPPLWL